MYEYKYVTLEREGGIVSNRFEEHRRCIDQYAAQGWRYAGYVPVKVNGKLKGTVTMPAGSEEKAVADAALTVDKVQKATAGMKLVKTIFVKDRLVNLIVKPQ